MQPGVVYDWDATIPLQPGPNEVEFTVFDACGAEGRSTRTLTSAAGVFCGNGVVESGEQCDDGNGVSGDCCSGACAIEPDGSVCDDGDVCSAASACSAGVCVGSGSAPGACGESYLCYKSAVTRGTLPFFPVSGVALADPLGGAEVNVRRADQLCLPGSVDGGPILAPAAYLVGYRMKESTKRALPGGIRVTDRFGAISVDPLRASALLTPSAMQLDAPPAPLAPGIVDHHECYAVRLTAGKYPKGVVADMADAFENRSYVIRKPAHLCLAVDRDGAGVANPNAHLMCYRTVHAPGESKHRKIRNRIRIEDSFGPLRLDTKRESELCVPATIDAPIL